MIQDLQQAVNDLKDINEQDIKYLLANRNLSFMDESTLGMIEKRISQVVVNLEKLYKSKA
ncbi:hypothetical protein [Acinetobacter bohemicus]|uniref:hypothetical protein n=1 Tax=Acinetobacter bohemicus TaxID=1435036 RepID=UPI0040423987